MNKVRIAGMLAAAVLAAAAVVPATAGASSGTSNGVAPGEAAPSIGSHVINFDGMTVPCLFGQTLALRQFGLTKFAGPTTGGLANGGAVLNECGNFGVTGYSAPNFLAFNCNSALNDGAIPVLPESIRLPGGTLHTNVSINVGSAGAAGQTLAVTGTHGTTHETHKVVLSSAMQTVTFATAVSKIRLTGNSGVTPCILVVDDIAFD